MEANAASQATSPPGTAWAVALKNLWQWARRAVKARKARRLRVCETLSLGERRFLAVIEFDRQEFLVGGSGNSLELLGAAARGNGDSRTFPAAGVARPLRAGEFCHEEILDCRALWTDGGGRWESPSWRFPRRFVPRRRPRRTVW